MNSAQKAASLIKTSQHGVVLTGAGISTPSGIPDFRSPGTGLWTRYLPMEVASLTAFRHNPEQFFKSFHPLAVQMSSAQPNAAHYALAKMQAAGYVPNIITQNIDGLISRAGAKQVIEIHGSLSTLTCTSCFKKVASQDIIDNYIKDCTTPRCKFCGSFLKPDVILYEEQLPVKAWQDAETACKESDLLLVAGTSLEVLPTAKLPIYALENGARLIIINNSDTFIDKRADIVIKSDVAEVLPLIAKELIND